MHLLACLYVGLLGACLGSFLTVVIHRLPRRASVVRPRSQCPRCGAPVAWFHNVPVAGYLWLRGRCATCRAPLPLSYLMVEGATALACAALYHLFGWSPLTLRYGVLVALLIAAAEIDRRHGLLPNRLVVGGAGLGLLLLLVTDAPALATHGLAALAAAGLLLLIRGGSAWLFGRPGLGMGDVKLAALVGVYLGWPALWVFYLAVLLGGTLGGIGLLTGRLARTTRLPFAPFVACGAGLHLFFLPPELVWPL